MSSSGNRNLTKGANNLNFNVYHPGSISQVLSSGNKYTYSQTITASGWQTINFSFPGIIPTNQNVEAGIYNSITYNLKAKHPNNTGSNSNSTSVDVVSFRSTVDAMCEVTVNDMLFGSYDASSPVDTDSSAAIALICTPSENYALSVNPGSGSGSYATRVLSKSADTLDYNIYTDGGYSIVWGDGTSGTGVLSGTTTGSSQSATYYGRIPKGQYEPSGIYSSTVTMTLNFPP